MTDTFVAEVQAYAAKAAADVARAKAEQKARNNALFPDFIAFFREAQKRWGGAVKFVGCVGTGPDNAGAEMGKVDDAMRAAARAMRS